MRLTKAEAQKRFPNGVFLGELFWIGQGAIVGRGAIVWRGAIVGQGAIVAIIVNKYICNISPLAKTVNIRMGCEIHTIDEWEAQKEAIADRNDRKWWDESGVYIYEFLKGEAQRYTDRFIVAIPSL